MRHLHSVPEKEYREKYLPRLSEESYRNLIENYLNKKSPKNRSFFPEKIKEFLDHPRVKKNFLAAVGEEEALILSCLYYCESLGFSRLCRLFPQKDPDALRESLRNLEERLLIYSYRGHYRLSPFPEPLLHSEGILHLRHRIRARPASNVLKGEEPPLDWNSFLALWNFGFHAKPGGDFSPGVLKLFRRSFGGNFSPEIDEKLLDFCKRFSPSPDSEEQDPFASFRKLSPIQFLAFLLSALRSGEEGRARYLYFITVLQNKLSLSREDLFHLIRLLLPFEEEEDLFRFLREYRWLILDRRYWTLHPRLRNTPPRFSGAFSLQADFSVILTGTFSYSLFFLSSIARLESFDQTLSFRLSKESLYRAFDNGHSAETLLDFLRKHSINALPDNVRNIILEWFREYQTLSFHSGVILKVSPEKEEVLKHIGDFTPYIRKELAPGIYLLRGRPAEWRKVLASVGEEVLPRIPAPPDSPEDGPTPLATLPGLRLPHKSFSFTPEAPPKEQSPKPRDHFKAELRKIILKQGYAPEELKEYLSRLERNLILHSSQLLPPGQLTLRNKNIRGFHHAERQKILEKALRRHCCLELEILSETDPRETRKILFRPESLEGEILSGQCIPGSISAETKPASGKKNPPAKTAGQKDLESGLNPEMKTKKIRIRTEKIFHIRYAETSLIQPS